jgi:ferrous iron transport protein A
MNSISMSEHRAIKSEKGLIPLALMREGEVVKICSLPEEKLDLEVVRINERCHEGCGGFGRCLRKKKTLAQKVQSMGLRVGQTVEVKKNQPGQPMVIRVDETFIALSRGLAMKIMVCKGS